MGLMSLLINPCLLKRVFGYKSELGRVPETGSQRYATLLRSHSHRVADLTPVPAWDISYDVQRSALHVIWFASFDLELGGVHGLLLLQSWSV